MGSGVIGFSILGWAVAATMIGGSAYADPVENPFEKVCPKLGDVVRSNDPDCPSSGIWSQNSVCRMTPSQAEHYCRNHGWRLPTVRELALTSQCLGARGIRETAHPGVVETNAAVQAEIAQMRAAGYYPIYTRNGSNQPFLSVVAFYLNIDGYQRPAGDLGHDFFLSASVRSTYSTEIYYLSGRRGDISCHYSSSDDGYYGVRCVQ